MSLVLNDVAKFMTSKVDVSEINETNYVSTENMISNKGGITIASSLPDTKSVRKYFPKDILINNIRPYFKKIWYSDMEGGCSNDIFVIRSNENYDSKFLYYVLSSDDFFSYVMANAKGTKMPRGDKKAILNYEVPDFSIDEQKRISFVLGEIDKKIDVNKRLNKNLLKLSKYLYKEFYLDKVESYDKKQYVTLDDVTSKFATGLNPRKNFVLGEGDNYYVTIKNMANNSIVLDDKCASITDEALIKINKRSDLQVGDLLFSGIGTIGRVHLIDENPTNWNISESVFTMRPNDLISSEFLFIMLLSQEVQEYAKTLASGSVQKGIRMRDLKAYEFILPNNKDKLTLDSLLIPIIADIKSNEKEIRKLTKLRDTLLPKLMSGEIDTSKINCDMSIKYQKLSINNFTLFYQNSLLKVIL